ncbi:RusA family crossover junction endodeoxyribonuclease [bacterium]|nr:RusA family crossover junction endodeoxyribonuclease [bacterium]
MIELPIEPVAKPRQTQRDKWQQRPVVMKYRAFADELRLRCRVLGFQLTGTLDAVFVLPMPKSWSKKKRAEMDGTPHLSKPDTDNLEKAVQDALCVDDSHIWKHRTEKVWGYEGKIIFRK